MITIVGTVPERPKAQAWDKSYSKRCNAQRAAIATLGPEAREGFEFISSQRADGAWGWKPTDEVPPMTAQQAKVNGVTYHPPASPPAVAMAVDASDPGSIPAFLVRENTPEQQAKVAAIVKADNNGGVRMPRDNRTTVNPREGRKHAADIADLFRIVEAVSFLTTLFINGAFDKRPAETLEQARANAEDMIKVSGTSRRPMVYAILADGTSIFVPADYDPATFSVVNAATVAKNGGGRRKGKAPRKTASKAAGRATAGERKRYDWKGAEENAAAGKVPAAIDFSAPTHAPYRKMLEAVVAAAKAGDQAALKAIKINPTSSSPKAVERYRKLCLKALRAAA